MPTSDLNYRSIVRDDRRADRNRRAGCDIALLSVEVPRHYQTVVSPTDKSLEPPARRRPVLLYSFGSRDYNSFVTIAIIFIEMTRDF